MIPKCLQFDRMFLGVDRLILHLPSHLSIAMALHVRCSLVFELDYSSLSVQLPRLQLFSLTELASISFSVDVGALLPASISFSSETQPFSMCAPPGITLL